MRAGCGKSARPVRWAGVWKRSHGKSYTGTKRETSDTDKDEPEGPPRQLPTLPVVGVSVVGLSVVGLCAP